MLKPIPLATETETINQTVFLTQCVNTLMDQSIGHSFKNEDKSIRG